MVAGRQGIKYINPTTFSHADSGGFEKPPLRKHKRCVLLGGSVDSDAQDDYIWFCDLIRVAGLLGKTL
jgi:hypothetical protein